MADRSLRAAKDARAAVLLLRFEVLAVGFGLLFTVTAIVCALLLMRARTQRQHEEQIYEAKVRRRLLPLRSERLLMHTVHMAND